MENSELDFEIKNIANRGSNPEYNSLKYRLSMDPEMDRFQHALLGLMKNPQYHNGPNKGEKYVLLDEKAQMCGLAGAIQITNFLRAAVDKVASDTKLDEKTIKRETAWFDKELCQFLLRNMRKLDIVPSYARAIASEAVRTFILTLNRSIGGVMMDGLNKGMSHSEVHHYEEKPKKKHFENFLQGGG